MATIEQLSTAIQTRFPSQIERIQAACGELTLELSGHHLREVCLTLRDDPAFDFKLLVDVCGVDYLQYGISEWETESATSTGFERGRELYPHPHAHAEKPPVYQGGEDLTAGAVPPPETSHYLTGTAIPLTKTSDKAAPGAVFAPKTTDELAKNAALAAKKHEDTAAKDTAEAVETSPASQTLPPFEKGKGRFTKHRFASVYHLLSLNQNHRLRLRVFIDAENPQVPSVTDIWPAANWFEREAFDLFGIIFVGHPDLRRILTDYGFVGHPFRKDFPLIGNVEARYDAKTRRVIYEPVSIQHRTLEPKVIRLDARYEDGGTHNG